MEYNAIIENNEDRAKYIPVLEDMNKNYYKGFIMRHDDYIRNMNNNRTKLVTENDNGRL